MAIAHNETGGFLEIHVDHSDLDRLIHGALSPAAQKRIQMRAINETTAWLKGRVLKELPSATGIPRKILSRRIKQSKARDSISRGGVTGMVWLGTKPVEAIYLKDEGPAGAGYMAGGFYFAGGFKAKMRGGHTGLYARTGRARMPIKKLDVSIDNQVNAAVRRLIRPAELALAQKMNRLLSYELEQATR
jgi:hypothetical protein